MRPNTLPNGNTETKRRAKTVFVSTEIALFGGGFLQGDQHYNMMTFSHTSYFRTVGKFVLSLKGLGGILVGLDEPDEVPFWKRFRLGGISRYGLRGYDDFDEW